MWINRKKLDELEARIRQLESERDLLSEILSQRQIEAHQVGLDQGIARGQIIGQAQAFSAVEQQVRERGGTLGEVTEQDVERARKGLIH